MKTNKLFILAIILCGAMVGCTPNVKGSANAEGKDTTAIAEVKVNVNDLRPSKSQLDSVSYLMGVNFGSIIKGYNFGDLNFSQIKKGMNDFIKAKGNMRDSSFNKQFKINPEEINDIFNTYLKQRQDYTAAISKEKEIKFLNKNKKNKDVIVTESGLQYTILKPGNDLKPGPEDTVFAKYVGTLPDGSIFDAQKDSIEFTLNGVIPGWTEGLQLIGEGGKIKLVIPSSLAYGERGNQGIDPNTPLTFEVELCKVIPFVAPTKK